MTAERDEAREELERLHKRTAVLEDEQHYLQSDFEAKKVNMMESFAAQLKDLVKEANEHRTALQQLQAEHETQEGIMREYEENLAHAHNPIVEVLRADLVRHAKMGEEYLQVRKFKRGIARIINYFTGFA